MPDFSYSQLADYLGGLSAPDDGNAAAPVYLIFGEEMLVQRAFNDLLAHLVPVEQRSLAYEPMDGTTAAAADVLECVNTYALTAGQKVVAWRDARLFQSQTDPGRMLDRARAAAEEDDISKAAGLLLRFLGSAGLSLDDVGGPRRDAGLLPQMGDGRAYDWMDELVAYCRQHDLNAPAAAGDQTESVKRAIEKGWPRGHRLIITTDAVDRRQALFKVIRERGVVIDCSVPLGNRRTDQQTQENVLLETMQAALRQHGKTMDRTAFHALCAKTGFDLRTFANNLEILVSYVGAREAITAADVATVLERSKKDPIFELTNAVSDRSIDDALFFLASLLDDGAHPLQILAALTNQIRRLLLAKDFVASRHGRAWSGGCSYRQFQDQVLPAVQAYDGQLLEELALWQQALQAGAGPSGRKKTGRKKGTKTPGGDLLLAKNPKNAYPVFMLLRKSERFAKTTLAEALQSLADADRYLKSSGQNPKLILERVILQLGG